MKLLLNAVLKFTAGLLLMFLLLFPAAGTFNFPNGWLFLGLLFIPMLILGAVLYFKAPELLKKRLNSKEKEGAQKKVILLSLLVFIAGFIVAGLDFRFGWSNIPTPIVVTASVIQLLSYAMYAEVMRENAYLSRTVEVQKDQKVIDTGLYGVIRHPMYTAATFLFLSIPVVLGSWFALIIFAVFPALLIARIKNEEEVLEKGLKGYAEYKKKVKYRLIPFIW